MDLTNWTPLRDLDRLFNRMHPLALELNGDGPGIRLLDKNLFKLRRNHSKEYSNEHTMDKRPLG